MTEVGHAVSVDVDLDLVTEDREPCLWNECNNEAVWNGVISTPCGCPQPVCIPHHELESTRWKPGDAIHCYFCHPKTEENSGEFVRWERL